MTYASSLQGDREVAGLTKTSRVNPPLPMSGAHVTQSKALADTCAAVVGSGALCDESARGYALRMRHQRDWPLAQKGTADEEPTSTTARVDRLCKRACFCPECFANTAYWRENWETRGVLACLEHRLRLVAICPVCDKRLSWRRPDLAHCGCGFPLVLWRREIAGDAEMLVTSYVLGVGASDDRERNPLRELTQSARVSFLRALGYAWMGNPITEQQRLGGRGEDGDARAFAAAGEALSRLKNPALFLVKDFAGFSDPNLLQLQKLVATELYRGTRPRTGRDLHQYLQTAVAKLFAGEPVGGSVLSYWIPIFLGGSGNWPADVEPLRRWGGLFPAVRCRTIWTKHPERVALEAIQCAWHARCEGLSSRECAALFNVPMSIIARMFSHCGYVMRGRDHKYPRQAIDELLGRYQRSSRIDEYTDIATVLRYGMTISECVRRLLDPAIIRRRAVVLVHKQDGLELMFAKWVLPYFWSVRVVVPYGYGGIHCDLRWTSVAVAARFLRVEREAIIRWVDEGRMGVILPGVPSEDMGIPRETLRRIRRSQQGWHYAERSMDWNSSAVAAQPSDRSRWISMPRLG